MAKPLKELLDLWESPTGTVAEQGDEMARRLRKLSRFIESPKSRPVWRQQIRHILDGEE